MRNYVTATPGELRDRRHGCITRVTDERYVAIVAEKSLVGGHDDARSPGCDGGGGCGSEADLSDAASW